ncbi:MAG: polymer-forming cytoskeletal protein [Pseudomonadota bacterium]|jgi:cytoskeletal protein CcmA (bactofilin family)|nr:polymer-forming cytoskeletal protein [Gammaproteobacteria bacterium]MBU1733362.1 polymer-forming cytoskeletal protein [Gammaproteobacteria bacterium]MBU1892410.1 polymer-forming cytoskeletal protein [Gammaproteobacteria bacterium]
MFGRKSTTPQNRIDSLIGHGTRIVGDISFTGGLRIDGNVIGNVRAEAGQASTLVLSEQARVEGAIEVSHLVVNGTVAGPVYVSEYVELQAKSRVTGDVYYKTLEMHVGAIVEGKLVHQEKLALPSPEAIEGSIVVD